MNKRAYLEGYLEKEANRSVLFKLLAKSRVGQLIGNLIGSPHATALADVLTGTKPIKKAFTDATTKVRNAPKIDLNLDNMRM